MTASSAIQSADQRTVLDPDAQIEQLVVNLPAGGQQFVAVTPVHKKVVERSVRVNSIHPAYISTPMIENGQGGDAEAWRNTLIALHPVGHLGDTDDIAWGVVYLASEEAKFVTGSELVIDGGYTAQ